MKTLRKVSFENFERLTVVEASQLYGGTGDNPPTTPMPTDSIPVNKNDSIPSTPVIPKKTPQHTISGGIKSEPNKSTTFNMSYTVKNGKWTYGGTASYNAKTGWTGNVTGSYTFGGK